MKSKFLIPLLLLVAFLIVRTGVKAQEQLIHSLSENQSLKPTKFVFTTIANAEATSVKDQKASGACWSFSTNSFLESEMIRMGKKPVDLADFFTTRNAVIEKGISYVRMHGAVNLGDGGTSHDVINMYAKYGALPQVVYKGNNYGTILNTTQGLNRVSKSFLQKVVSSSKNEIDSNWKKQYTAQVDQIFGAVPINFTYEGTSYTPLTFAKEVIGINPQDYIELSSYNNAPYYKQTVLMVPDNWSFDKVYNVRLTDMTDIIDNALKNGFTVAWAADITEKYFSWKNGMAFVPEKEVSEMSREERSSMFETPRNERVITEELRQQAFDDYETTDDHGMQITGLVKDQNGKEYYLVKNSWGTGNDYKGYIYVTKAYVKYKTTAFLLNKNGIPKAMLDRLSIK
jgi:bleomycin hydrolase